MIDKEKFEYFLSSMKNAQIRFTAVEREIIRTWARIIMIDKEQRKTTDQLQTKTMGREEGLIEGLSGEMAYARQFRIYPDFYVGECRRADFDHYGYLIDVKSTKRVKGDLNVKFEKADPEKRCDYYVLMEGSFESGIFRYAGWARASDIFQPEWIADFGNGPYYAYPQRLLK